MGNHAIESLIAGAEAEALSLLALTSRLNREDGVDMRLEAVKFSEAARKARDEFEKLGDCGAAENGECMCLCHPRLNP